MDSHTWNKGKNIKAQYEISGRQIDLPSFAVAMILAAREEGESLEAVLRLLIQASEYESHLIEKER